MAANSDICGILSTQHYHRIWALLRCVCFAFVWIDVLAAVCSLPAWSQFLVQKEEYTWFFFSLCTFFLLLRMIQRTNFTLIFSLCPTFLVLSMTANIVQCSTAVGRKISSRIQTFWRIQFCNRHLYVQKYNSKTLFLSINVPYSLRLKQNWCL